MTVVSQVLWLLVSTHSRLKAAGWLPIWSGKDTIVSTHSRLKAAGKDAFTRSVGDNVSTHSRLKAAGFHKFQRFLLYASFNTQPPEGGWVASSPSNVNLIVSTHSRLKAAGIC